MFSSRTKGKGKLWKRCQTNLRIQCQSAGTGSFWAFKIHSHEGVISQHLGRGIQPRDSSAFWREKKKTLGGEHWTQSPPPSSTATWRSPEPQAHRPIGLSAGPSAPESLEPPGRSQQTQRSGPEPEQGRAPRWRAVPASTLGASSRSPELSLGDRFRQQVRGGVGESARLGARVSPAIQCQFGVGIAQRLTTSHSGIASQGKDDVIVAGRCRKVPPMGDRQSGLLSVSLGQY